MLKLQRGKKRIRREVYGVRYLWPLFLIYLSIVYGICTGFQLEDYRAMVMTVAIFFFGYWSILASSPFHETKWLRWIFYVQYCALAFYVFWERRQFIRGIRILENRLFAVINTTFHREFSYFSAVNESTAQSDIIITVTIALLLYSGILLLCRRHTWLVVLWTMPVILFTALCGPQAIHGEVFFYLGSLMAMTFFEQWKRKTAVIAFSLLACVGLIYKVYPSTELYGGHMTKLRQGTLVLLEYSHNIARGEKSVFTLNFGDIKNAASQEHIDDQVQLVEMETIEEQSYFKRYVANRYHNGKWSGNQQQLLEEKSPFFEFGLQDMLTKEEGNGIRRTSLVLHNTGERQQISPYYIIEETDGTYACISVYEKEKLLELYIPSYSSEIPAEYYALEQKEYEKAVSNNLGIPKKIRKELEEVRREYYTPGSNLKEAYQSVKGYLKSYYTYTKEKSYTPKGQDPVLYFLTRSQRGDCSQYASAAVFMFRSCGIPARYVEGYMLKEADFKKASLTDGKLVMPITSGNAYAWAELYVRGIGWVPVDVTPSNSIVAASDAREIALPRIPKVVKSPRELIGIGARIFLSLWIIFFIRVAVCYWYTRKKREKMSIERRICEYGVIWERYREKEDPVIMELLNQARYSNHAFSEAQEKQMYEAAWQAREAYRQKMPWYMNVFDGFLMCRDIL